MSDTIASLELELQSSTNGAVKGLEALADTLGRIKRATKDGLGLNAVTKELKNQKKATDDLVKSNNKLQSSNKKSEKSFTEVAAKVAAAYLTFKKVGKIINGFIKESNDYVENMNLFTVSMGQYAGEAKKYAENVSDLMGIDVSDWARNQGVFMTLATGFGVAGDRANTMSQQLTQLGYDISSFYNISVEDAMQKLQLGISGELEPLRRLGYDLSQAKLEATALSLGIDKSVSSMTQAEKAQLRYHAIMTQVTTSHGDMARTIESPANQLRILTAQVTQTGRAIGNIFIPALTAALPYVNAFLQVIRAIADVIAGLFGYEFPEFDYSGVDGMASGAEDLTEGLDEATDAAKKLKSYTMGFDELNVLNPNSGDSGNAGDVLGGDAFSFDLPTYDFLKGLEESKVGVIVEEMKEWLGITDDIDGWSELMDTRFGRILTTVRDIAGAFALWKLSQGLVSTISTLSTMLQNPNTGLFISSTLIITGSTLMKDAKADIEKKGANGGNVVEMTGGGLLNSLGGWLGGKAIGTYLMKALGGTKLGTALTKLGGSSFFGSIGSGIGSLLSGIDMLFTGATDQSKNGQGIWNTILTSLGLTGVGMGTGAITGAAIGSVGGPLGSLIGLGVGLAAGIIYNMIIYVYEHWYEIGKAVGDVFEKLGETWDTVLDWINWDELKVKAKEKWDDFLTFIKWDEIKTSVGETWDTFLDWIHWDEIQAKASAKWDVFLEWIHWGDVKKSIKETWDGFKDWINWDTIKSDMGVVWDEFLYWIDWGDARKKIGETWKGFKDWINWDEVKNDVTPKWEAFTEFVSWDNVKSSVGETWNTFADWITWDNIKTTLSEKFVEITDTVTKPFNDMKTAIIGTWKSMWTDLATVINDKIIGGIESFINGCVDSLNKLIESVNKLDGIPGVSVDIGLIKPVSIKRIPVETRANGGFVDSGQLFVAREAGAEMVGSIGRRTAVANNDQIVAGITSGVAEANSEQNALLREQNALLRALLDKDSNVNLDGRRVTKQLDRVRRERGATIVTGGAY